MKRLAFSLIVVAILSHSRGFADSLPLPPPDLPAGWQRVQILEVGTIDIPPTMEVQSGKYAELSQALKKSMFDLESGGTGKITIQQKGMNSFDPVAAESYVRVMLETDVGNPKDFEHLASRYEAMQDELREISTLFRTQAENQYAKILQWDVPSLELVSGMQAIRLSYRRQYQSNPPVRVTTYMFQNHDRMHRLTMSYREAERTKWLADFPTILSSFRITNVRGTPTQSTDDPMAFVFGENWVLTLILSAILTWGIGLAPPLLLRFAFLRRPMPKAGAIAFVVVFWFTNIVIFTALGSQSKTHRALFLVAVASYYILRRGAKKGKKPEKPPLLPQQKSTGISESTK
jgi:hypothetical protein